MSGKRAVLLVGHGGVPSDFPKTDLKELVELEKRRQASGETMSEREAELDRKIRTWPRTRKTEPYRFGVDAIAEELRKRSPGIAVETAYNEFCAPGVDEALESLAKGGVEEIQVVTLMMTPGGYHSEIEIPAFVREAQEKFSNVKIRYLWPFDLGALADFLAAQLARQEL